MVVVVVGGGGRPPQRGAGYRFIGDFFFLQSFDRFLQLG